MKHGTQVISDLTLRLTSQGNTQLGVGLRRTFFRGGSGECRRSMFLCAVPITLIERLTRL